MSTKYELKYISQNKIGDEKRLTVSRRDLSGGQNTRNHPSHIRENQAESLKNVDIETAGQRKKRKGSVQISDDMGTSSVVALHDYERNAYPDQLLIAEDNDLNTSQAESNHTEIKGDFSSSTDVGMVSAKESGLTPDDVVFVNFGSSNWWRVHLDSGSTWSTQDLGNTEGTGSDSPPQSTVGAWYGNRFWVLSNTLLYYSSAYSSDYSAAFDTANNSYRIPVGDERAIIPTRTEGLIVAGKKEIWGLNPSATPSASDKPVPLVTSHGMVSKDGWCTVGNDIFYFAQDGLRSLHRSMQDKLQQKTSNPISHQLKDEFSNISWANITKLSIEYWDNKVFVSVPTGASSYKIWVYYPAYKSFMVIDGWNSRCFATYKVSGEERFYYGKEGDGKVYRGWYGYTDEGTTTSDGTAITMTEQGREEDFGQPLIKKVGGDLEIEAFSAGGAYSFDVYAKPDGTSYRQLGTLDLQEAEAPTLPIDLPFTLSESYIMRKKFPLDTLGEFRTLQIKLVNTDANSEEIKIYGTNLVTFPMEYQNE